MAGRVAQCSCKACTIEVTGEPSLNGICHCNDCRRRTGSAFGWNVYFPQGQVGDMSGPLQKRILDVQPPQERWFCSQCGTNLYWISGWRPDDIGMAAGTLSPLPEMPGGTYTDTARCEWVLLPQTCAIVS
jgi:hypothetical protein